MTTRPCALTIAGSDSGGGAGIQADLRVLSRLGVFGTTAITAITAQNLDGVTHVMPVTPESVGAQIHAVLDGFAPGALKTGMLFSRAIVELVADIVRKSAVPMVVDPVMIATSGARLVADDAIAAYRDILVPCARLVTPNLDEAAVLLECDAIERADIRDAAARLHQRFGCPVLLKGGHLLGDPIDILHHDHGMLAWTHRRIEGVNTHGTGCMLSAAIAGFLARDAQLVDACEAGLAFVHDALAAAHEVTPGQPLAAIESATPDTRHLRRLASL